MAAAAAAAGAGAGAKAVDRSPTPEPPPARKRQIEERKSKARQEAARYRSAPPTELLTNGFTAFASTATATTGARWIAISAKASASERSRNRETSQAAQSVRRWTDSTASVLASLLKSHYIQHAEEDGLVITSAKTAVTSSAKATLPELHLASALAIKALTFRIQDRSEEKTATADLRQMARFFSPDTTWNETVSRRRIELMEMTGLLLILRRLGNAMAAASSARGPVPLTGSKRLTIAETPEYKSAIDQLSWLSFAVYGLTFLADLREKFPVAVGPRHASLAPMKAVHVQSLFDVVRPLLLDTISTALQGASDEHVKHMMLHFMAEKRYQRAYRNHGFLYGLDDVMHVDAKIVTPEEIAACNAQLKLKASEAAEYTAAEMEGFERIRQNRENQIIRSAADAVPMPGSSADLKDQEKKMRRPAAAAAAAAAAPAATGPAAPVANRASAIDAAKRAEEEKQPRPPMKSTTKDAWIFQAFSLWFRQQMGYDFSSEHCVMWGDWSFASRSRNRLFNSDPDRRPYVVCLGSDHWFVQHRGALLQFQCGVGRTMIRALALWCMIIVKEFKGVTLAGHKLTISHLWPDVMDVEGELSKLTLHAREAEEKRRTAPPNVHALLT